MKEFEVYLPLNYNDGTPVEKGKIDKVGEDLLEFFGGLTFFPQKIKGFWKMGNVIFRDEIVIFRVITDKPPLARRFLKRLQKELKKEFQQEEILIVEKDAHVLRG